MRDDLKNNLLNIFVLIFLLYCFIPVSSIAQDNKESIFLTMEDAISRALSQNNQVRAGKYALKKANWDKWHAWTLLMPTVTLNSRYTWIDDSTFALRDFFRTQFQDVEMPGMPADLNFEIPQTVFQKTYSTSIDLNMPLFNGAILNGLFIASENETMFEQLDESTKRNIIFQVIASYLNALKNKEIFELQKEYLHLSQLNYEKAERLHEAGRYSKSDALRWKVEYQQQKSTVVNSESNLRSAKTILSRLVSAGRNENLEIEDKVPQFLSDESRLLSELPDQDILNLIDLDDEKLAEVNAALAAAKSGEEISKYTYRNSYSSYLPNVSLSYSHAWFENNTIELDGYSPKTLMVNFSMPIFTSFQNFTSVKSAYYDYKQSQENFADQLQNTRYILTQTVNNILNLKTQVELSATNVEFNEHNYRIVEQQKEQGLISNIDFIDAKLNLQNAKLTQISNRYDFISGIVELYYLLGKLNMILSDDIILSDE